MVRLGLLVMGCALALLLGVLAQPRTSAMPPLLAYVAASPGTESKTVVWTLPSPHAPTRPYLMHETVVCSLRGGPEHYLLLAPVSGAVRCTALDYLAARWSPSAGILFTTPVTRGEAATLDAQAEYVVASSELCLLREREVCQPFVGNVRVRWQNPSPTSTQVAFIGDLQNGERVLVVAQSEAVRLLRRRLAPDQDITIPPIWSPDGTKLAFFVGGGAYVLWTYDLETGAQVSVATVDAQPIVYGEWSPDGEWLAWQGRRTTDGVYVTHIAHGHTVKVTQSAAAQRGFAWIGEQLVFNDGGYLYASGAPFDTRTQLAPGHSPVMITMPAPRYHPANMQVLAAGLVVVALGLGAGRGFGKQ